MKKRICAAFAAAVMLLLAGCGGKKSAPRRSTVASEMRQFSAPQDGDVIAIFSTNMGEIRAVLYPEQAPMAVYNFVGMARNGYYDGTAFWRSEYGFAVQGGDPTGTGNSTGTIWSNNLYPLEASEELRHYAGALCAAFASGGEQEGGTSQFYFVTALPDSVDKTMQESMKSNGYTDEQVSAYADAGGLPYLDNTDTVFGQIYEGMEIADKMACVETKKDEDGNDTFLPSDDAQIVLEHVTISVYPGPTSKELEAQFTS